MKSTRFIRSFRLFSVCILLIWANQAFADTTIVSADISATGDIPAVSLTCTIGHDYLLSLVHRDANVVSYSYGPVQHLPCVNGTIIFDAFNLNNLLVTNRSDSWWNLVRPPLEYIIKDVTGIFACDQNNCPLVNLAGPANNYDYSAYLASSTTYQTVAYGPIFDTSDYATWTNKSVVPISQPDGDSNVLFIPGLEASRLYEKKTVLGVQVEDQLWEPNISGDGVALYLNASGLSINPNIYTRDIIKESNTPIPTGPLGQNIYKSFSNMMDSLVSNNTIASWQSFPYDWRQDVEDIVDNGTQYQDGNHTLISVLQALISTSKSGKVTIVAHSNGGLIAKALLRKLEDDKIAGRNNLIDKIDTVILVASPQLGTPSAIPAILHGYDQDINPFYVFALLNVSTARQLGINMPGAYGLLPSAEYFNRVNNSVVSFVPNILDPYMTKEISTYGQSISSYLGEKSFMLGSDGRPTPSVTDTLRPFVSNSTLFSAAENLHSKIDTMTVPSNIRVIQIAGWGLDTIAGFQYTASSTCPLPTSPGCTGNFMLDEVPIFTSDGDKTVVTPSALAMSGEKWWLNLNLYNNDKVPLDTKNQHKNILEVASVLSFISSTIQETNFTSSLYMSTSSPVDITNRLRLSVHSPVTLDAYDSSGNHTGKVCPTSDSCYIEENIPNSGYYEFGEGKYINLPQTGLQKITLQGIDAGTFTFDSQVVSPNGQATTSSFVDIPVTTQTQAEITIDQTTNIPQLKLDVMGDGVTDFTLSPSTTFDPVTYLQIVRATVDSLDITDAKKKAFDTRVDNIIKSIQKGKIDKAKLKADRFVTVLENKLAKPDPKKPRPKKLSKTDAQTLLDMLSQLLDNIS